MPAPHALYPGRGSQATRRNAFVHHRKSMRESVEKGQKRPFWALRHDVGFTPNRDRKGDCENTEPARDKLGRAGCMSPVRTVRAGRHLMNAAIFRFVPTTLPVSATDEPARDSGTNRSFPLYHGALLATKLFRVNCTAPAKKRRDRRHTLSPLGREVSRPLPTCRSGLPIGHHSKPFAKNVAMGQKRTLRSLRPMSALPPIATDFSSASKLRGRRDPRRAETVAAVNVFAKLHDAVGRRPGGDVDPV